MEVPVNIPAAAASTTEVPSSLNPPTDAVSEVSQVKVSEVKT